ncbi:hypothetical protein DYQ86_01215 [Acidobacteria bacterium AB60]|nr:hypothetical protein DYQ86_01215 [Acidobacteria bacterium AB60]
MSITALAVIPNTTIQAPGLFVYSGIVECVFKGADGIIVRDTLSFVLSSPRISLAIEPVQASCIVSPASFAYDGNVNDALWAVDTTSVTTTQEDRGTGTAALEVFANLAVRGANGVILRVNYTVFVKQ